jgi:hypothetical protein
MAERAEQQRGVGAPVRSRQLVGVTDPALGQRCGRPGSVRLGGGHLRRMGVRDR